MQNERQVYELVFSLNRAWTLPNYTSFDKARTPQPDIGCSTLLTLSPTLLTLTPTSIYHTQRRTTAPISTRQLQPSAVHQTTTVLVNKVGSSCAAEASFSSQQIDCCPWSSTPSDTWKPKWNESEEYLGVGGMRRTRAGLEVAAGEVEKAFGFDAQLW